MALEDIPPGGLQSLVMLAPPGTIERRYAVALGLRALAHGAPLTLLAAKDKGGSRLRKELEAFGCDHRPKLSINRGAPSAIAWSRPVGASGRRVTQMR